MAIFTRMGSQVEVIGVQETGCTIWVRCRRQDGTEREFDFCDLIADEGQEEIEEAIRAAQEDGRAGICG